MRLKKISFKDFRLFENFELVFPDENFIVLIGNNGSGKTTILDGIAKCLEHFVGVMTSAEEKGHKIFNTISEQDLTIGLEKQTSTVTSQINVFDKEINFLSSWNKNVAGTTYEISDVNFLKDKKKQIELGTLRTYPILGYLDINRTNPLTSNDRKKNNLPLILDEVYNTVTMDVNNFSFVNDWYVAVSTEETFLKDQKKDPDFELESLKHIRKAFNDFLKELNTPFKGVTVQIQEGSPYKMDSITKFFFGVIKNEQILSYNQLSSGEKSIINIVFSIARKLVLGNRTSSEPLNGKGVILIDEIDLHLHPSWQVKIVKALRTTFPNVQFIMTTHSPLVLSGVRRNEIISLSNDGASIGDKIPNMYGATANEQLEKVLISPIQNEEVIPFRKELDRLILEDKYDEAEKLINFLKGKFAASDWLTEYEHIISFSKHDINTNT